MAKTSAQVLSIRKTSAFSKECLTLVCPAHNLASLRAAVENGANGIHIEYQLTNTHTRLETSLSHDAALRKGILYAHDRKVQIVLSFSQSHPCAASWASLTTAIRDASELGVDAISLSDPALMLYTAVHHPNLDIHYAVPQPMIEVGSIRLLNQSIPIKRVILPRIVSVSQIEEISRTSGIGVELVGFGESCSILIPRTDSHAASSTPLRPVVEKPYCESLLSDEVFHDAVGHCALSEEATNDQLYQHDHFNGWHALNVLPQLAAIQVCALRIEPQDDSSSKLARLTRVWREAIDECLQDTRHYNVRPAWLAELRQLSVT